MYDLQSILCALGLWVADTWLSSWWQHIVCRLHPRSSNVPMVHIYYTMWLSSCFYLALGASSALGYLGAGWEDGCTSLLQMGNLAYLYSYICTFGICSWLLYSYCLQRHLLLLITAGHYSCSRGTCILHVCTLLYHIHSCFCILQGRCLYQTGLGQLFRERFWETRGIASADSCTNRASLHLILRQTFSYSFS